MTSPFAYGTSPHSSRLPCLQVIRVECIPLRSTVAENTWRQVNKHTYTLANTLAMLSVAVVALVVADVVVEEAAMMRMTAIF